MLIIVSLSAKICLDDQGISCNLFVAPFRNLPAIIQNNHTVGDGSYHIQLVFNEQDGMPVMIPQALDEFRHFMGLLGVHPSRRLIQKQDPGVCGKGASDFHASPVGIGEMDGLLVKAVSCEPSSKEHQAFLRFPFCLLFLFLMQGEMEEDGKGA